MKIDELWDEVNKVATERHSPMVSFENFFTVLFTLECKGLVKLTDNNTVYLEAVKRQQYIKEKIKEL